MRSHLNSTSNVFAMIRKNAPKIAAGMTVNTLFTTAAAQDHPPAHNIEDGEAAVLVVGTMLAGAMVITFGISICALLFFYCIKRCQQEVNNNLVEEDALLPQHASIATSLQLSDESRDYRETQQESVSHRTYQSPSIQIQGEEPTNTQQARYNALPENIRRDNPAEGFLIPMTCPITICIMEDPVVASDGHTYERKALQEWLRQKTTSPMTREILTEQLHPNFRVKNAIETFLSNLEAQAKVLMQPSIGPTLRP